MLCRSLFVPFLLAFVLSVLLWFTDSDYPFSIFWPLCCLSFFDLRILITPSVSFGLCVVCPSLIYGFWLPLQYLLALVLSVLWFTDSDYLFSIFKLYFQNTTKRNELFSLKRTTFVLRSDWRISGLTPKWVSRGGDYHASLTSL
jgi:hypothetical protein